MGGPGISQVLGFVYGVSRAAERISNEENIAVLKTTDLVAPIVPKFNYTVQLGLSISGNYVNWSGGVVFDSTGRFGFYDTPGTATAVGANSFSGVTIQVSNAGSIRDLGGPFWNGSVGGGDGFDGTLDVFGGQGSHGKAVYGGGLTFGVGGGAGTSAGGTLTYIHPF